MTTSDFQKLTNQQQNALVAQYVNGVLSFGIGGVDITPLDFLSSSVILSSDERARLMSYIPSLSSDICQAQLTTVGYLNG